MMIGPGADGGVLYAEKLSVNAVAAGRRPDRLQGSQCVIAALASSDDAPQLVLTGGVSAMA